MSTFPIFIAFSITDITEMLRENIFPSKLRCVKIKQYTIIASKNRWIDADVLVSLMNYLDFYDLDVMAY